MHYTAPHNPRLPNGVGHPESRPGHSDPEAVRMCRSIKPLFNFDPPADETEIRAAALQYVRKVSGYTRPSRANEAAFERAVDDIARATLTLLQELQTEAPPRDREREAERARVRARKRFGVA